PSYAIRWARETPRAIIRGNHDKACSGMDSLEFYNASAQASATWTMAALSQDELDYLRHLSRGPLRFEDFDMVHGSPREEDEYLLEPEAAFAVRELLDSQVTFFGHSHVQGGFLLHSRAASVINPDLTLEVQPDRYYLVNPGSVGQPRDRDERAAYAVYHPEE